MKYRKKLIEVALPLDAINKESAREKSIRHGHPSTLHLWWARRPLAACRAVLFASLVDDPSSWPERFPTDEAQDTERQRLFGILEQLVVWENSNNETLLLAAQREIARSIAWNLGEEPPEGGTQIRKYLAEKAPPVLDPFCGGGSIPLEAQRLGLRAYGSDLNPVAVLITKALVEIPPKFSGQPPVNPKDHKSKLKTWKGASGLAEDVRYYGQWMRDEAEKRIGKYYPKVKITAEMAKERPDLKPYAGQELTVIAWLWARTVECPNPGCRAETPLVRSFWVSKKKGKSAYAYPILNRESLRVDRFEIRLKGEPLKHTTDRKGAYCLFCEEFISKAQVREICVRNGTDALLMTVVAEGSKSRVYLPSNECRTTAVPEVEASFLEQPLPGDARWFSPPLYGLPNYSDLFTSRQLLALMTFSDLVKEARERVLADAKDAGTLPSDDRPFDEDGQGPVAYADAVATYLAFGVDKLADRNSTISSWDVSRTNLRNTFGRQALPMTWDYAEGNPFSDSTGNWQDCLEWSVRYLEKWFEGPQARIDQLDSSTILGEKLPVVLATDPPYYDNIGYADLSDFFYIWLRRSIGTVYPSLFSTLLTPKSQELIASPYRHEGGKEEAQRFFETGLGKSFQLMRQVQTPNIPLTVFYAFKQSETEEDSNEDAGHSFVVSTGWETMLAALIQAGFSIHGTWPMRSELANRMIASGTNALASSIVLACRSHAEGAPLATRREFLNALKEELPQALRNLQHGNIAPVDLAQASIGPGMAVFTRYSKVIEADGSPMSVRTALALINQTLDEVLAEQEGEFDADTRWALAWFDQYGMKEGPYGVAETLSKAKNTAVSGLEAAGVVTAKAGKVRLLSREKMLEDWNPADDRRLTIWEVTQYLIRALEDEGEQGAAALLKKVGGLGEAARDLAYRLYSICERKKWAQEALAYNSLVVAWPEIVKLSQAARAPEQIGMG